MDASADESASNAAAGSAGNNNNNSNAGTVAVDGGAEATPRPATAGGREEKRRERKFRYRDRRKFRALQAHAGMAEHDVYDLSHRELNYLLLKRILIVTSWPFFGWAILFGLFATFPRHLRAPIRDSADHRLAAHHGMLRLAPKHAWMHVSAADEFYGDEVARAALSHMRALRLPNATCPTTARGWHDPQANGYVWPSLVF